MSNIKRIIFDLDNTLIPWQDKYIEGLKKAVLEHKIPFDISKESEIYKLYEQDHPNYTIEGMIKHFKKHYNLDVPKEFVISWLNNLNTMADINDETNQVLSYLKNKYDLVVLSNFYTECQKKRLEHAGMLKYFTAVYGGDTYLKPNPESFKIAMRKYKPEECLMIGDDINIDIKGALNVSLNVIYLTKNDEEYPFPTIKSLQELKRIL